MTLASSYGAPPSMPCFACSPRPLCWPAAVWTGVGACGTAAIGMAFFKESTAAPRVIALAVIVAGIVGLKVFDDGASGGDSAGGGLPAPGRGYELVNVTDDHKS